MVLFVVLGICCLSLNGLLVQPFLEVLNLHTLFHAYVAHLCASQRCQVRSALQGNSDVACQRTDIGSLAAHHAYGHLHGLWVKLLQFNLVNDQNLGFDVDFLSFSGQVVALWTSLGTSFLSFIAGFQVVDKSLYEAASVDGVKNRWQELWNVTLPVMKNQMMFAAIMAITGAFGFGAIVTALCGFPSVDYAAHTIMHHLDDYGGQRWEVGYASAIATILFAIQIAANVGVNKLLSKVGK